MNGFTGQYGQPTTEWVEHHTPEGKAYYYNSATKVTQWTKPEELMTAAEVALSTQPWKEYTTAEGGRKYWYNSETKESVWEMPEAYKNALGITPTAYEDYTRGDTNREHRERRNHRGHYNQHDNFADPRYLSYTDPSLVEFVPTVVDPEYATEEEAHAAFTKMLKRYEVKHDWTYEHTLRVVIRDPEFRALKDARLRREAFDKYCEDVVIQDQEREKERLAKLRADFETMLKRHPEIVYYTRWRTARPIIEGEAIFRSTADEDERKRLFLEYVMGLKKAHTEEQTALRKSAMDGLVELLPKLITDPYTRWADAQPLIRGTQTFTLNAKYNTLLPTDILVAFQNHIKSLERVLNDKKQREKVFKYRRERKNRDAFKALLDELRKAGKIKAGSKWSKVYPLFNQDERYKAMMGQPGSTPMELFWDVVEEEERGLRGQKNDILDVLDDKRFEINATTNAEEFLTLMKDDRRTANIDRDILMLIFERLREKRERPSKREDERQQRRAVDDLRLYMKRMEPPIGPADSYDKVLPRLQTIPEFQAVTSEDARRNAFEKHTRRLREKEEDSQRKNRHFGRSSMERDRHNDRNGRDRSRGERPYRSNARFGRRSRSPVETDAYEADRRKAIAEREKNHRKATTMAENLLSNDRGRMSPQPRRDRERERDRDRDYDRRDRERERDRDRERERERDRDLDLPPRPRRDDDAHYDKERRDREDDRERLYRRRVADRGSYDELPYGDERPAGSRRRRPDEEDDTRKENRDSKRIKRESPERSGPRDRRTKTPPTVVDVPKRDIRSGSEEGEIEEGD